MSGMLFGPLIEGTFGALSDEKNRQYHESENEKERQRQYEFAKNSLTWRMEDAKRAGIHPLAALGFQGVQSTPIQAGDFGDSLANMGQSISRAMTATQSALDREDTEILNNLGIERARLQNDLLRLQISNVANQINPPQPSPIEKQVSSDVGYVKTDSGGYAIVPSEEVKQRIEDSPYEWAHGARNIYITQGPRITPDMRDPSAKLKPGHFWQWNPVKQQYYQVPQSSREPRQMVRSIEKFMTTTRKPLWRGGN